MYIRIDKKIWISLALFVFIWHGFTVGWNAIISQAGKYYFDRIIYIFAIMVIMYYGKQHLCIKSMILPIAMMIVVCFFNNANYANNYNTIQEWSICACLIFYCVGNGINLWHSLFMKMLVIVGAFYSSTTILSMIIPSFFYDVCIPFFSHYGYTNKMISLYQRGYVTGFTPHYSTNAMYLAVTFGAIIAFAFVRKFTDNRINALALIVFASVLFTGKRAHAIFLIAAVVVLYLTIHCDEPVKRWEKILIITITAAVILIIAAQFIPQLLNVVNRFVETTEAGDVEMGRGETRAIALELWRYSPLCGIGWDAFKFFYREVFGVLLNVHCVYVQLLCEVGILGAFPFYVFFVSSLAKAIILLKKMTLDKEENSSKHLVIIYSVFIQVFFLLYCFTGNPLYDNPTLFTYLIGCAMSEYYWLNRERMTR